LLFLSILFTLSSPRDLVCILALLLLLAVVDAVVVYDYEYGLLSFLLEVFGLL